MLTAIAGRFTAAALLVPKSNPLVASDYRRGMMDRRYNLCSWLLQFHAQCLLHMTTLHPILVFLRAGGPPIVLTLLTAAMNPLLS